jgi:hypothetical protein
MLLTKGLFQGLLKLDTKTVKLPHDGCPQLNNILRRNILLLNPNILRAGKEDIFYRSTALRQRIYAILWDLLKLNS